jgi:hypothetical protein
MRALIVIILLGSLSAMSGCFKPDYGEGALRCGPGSTCPLGYRCIAQACWTQGHAPPVPAPDMTIAAAAAPDMTVGNCGGSRADCNGDPRDGCESDLTQPATCGSCSNACALPHVSLPLCVNGACGIGTCAKGFIDCNSDPVDGCETDGTTTSNCGACGNDCAKVLPNTNVACVAGMCVANMCTTGYSHCTTNTQDSCETRIDTVSHCGSCANDCTQLGHVAASSCSGAPLACGITTCVAGWADCDQRASTGCEADLSRPTTCGTCANDCTHLPFVDKASCSGGTCGIVACAPGRKNCTAAIANGCETDITQVTSCGDCNNNCLNRVANVSTVTCNGTGCGYDNCLPGYLDLDGDRTNGCESALPTGVPEAGSLEQWLTATDSLNGPLWPDHSGKNHPASCTGINQCPTRVQGPTMDTAAYYFNGTSNFLTDDFNAATLSNGVTLMFVWKPTAQASFTTLIEFNDGNGGWDPIVGLQCGGATDPNAPMAYYTCHQGGFNSCQFLWSGGAWAKSWNRFSLTHASDTSVVFRRNGGILRTGNVDLPVAASRANNLIGMDTRGTGTHFEGYISELAIYSTALSAASEAAVSNFFKYKYGLP